MVMGDDQYITQIKIKNDQMEEVTSFKYEQI